MRILLIALRIDTTPRVGGNQRTLLLYRALKRLGTIDLALLGRATHYSPAQLLTMQEELGDIHWAPRTPRGKRGPWRFVRPLNPKLVDRLAHNLGQSSVSYQPDPLTSPQISQLVSSGRYDLIVGRYLYPTATSGVLQAKGHIPVIVDLDDHDVSVYKTRLMDPATQRWERPFLRSHINALERIVPPLIDKCDHVWVSNANDIETYGLTQASALPNIPFHLNDPSTANARLAPANLSNRVVIIAAGNYRPNIRGVTHFVRNVWPRIRKQHSAAELFIYGWKTSDELRALWSATPGVTVVGFIENIIDAYKSAAFTVAPIYSGGGTNIKVVESLSYARTCVITPKAWRGYEHILQSNALLVAHDDRSFASCCLKLLQNPALRNQLAEEGHALVLKNFSFEHYVACVKETVKTVLHR